jgi:hypothetical protein
MPTTRELLQAQKRGAKIYMIHFDQEVRYLPRRKGDRLAWVWVGRPTNFDDFRVGPSELRIVEQTEPSS